MIVSEAPMGLEPTAQETRESATAPTPATDARRRGQLGEQADIRRWVVIAMAVVAAALVLFRFSEARDRSSLAFVDSEDLVITHPGELTRFADTTVWWMPSQRVQLAPNDAGDPTIRREEPGIGVVVGLETDEGLVGLNMVPSGLTAQPGELLVSPASTALTVMALHPDVSHGDPASEIARLAFIATSETFPALVSTFDGQPIARWDDTQRGLVQDLVTELADATSRPDPDCRNPEQLSGPVFLCANGVAQNVGARTAVLGVDGGEPCALIPAVTYRGGSVAQTIVSTVVAEGRLPDAGSAVDLRVSPGEADAAGCGLTPKANPASASDWAATSSRWTAWRDDIRPLAQWFGAVPAPSSDEPPAAVGSLLGQRSLSGDAVATPVDRLQFAADVLSLPRAITNLDMLPPTELSSARLWELVETVRGAM